MTVAAAERPQAEGEQAGLNANAIGFVGALVIGLASTAPAYSLAAVLGTLVVIVGVQAPAALLVSFVPMFFIAAAVSALIDLADERDARMIVIGSHGEGAICSAILGSTPHKLLQRSQWPVLVVPAPENDKEVSDGS